MVKTVEHPVEFLDSQDNGLVRYVGGYFETLKLQTFEQKAEAVALPIQYIHPVVWFFEEDEKHGIKDGNLDV